VAAVALAVTGLLGTVACTPDEPTAAPAGDACRNLVDEAAGEAEIADQILLLDQALVVCRSFERIDAALQRHPSLLGFDTATFVTNRCLDAPDEDIARSTICTSAVATTLAPVVTAPEQVYVGTTLDGRRVEIRPRPDAPFVSGNPAAIVTIVDIAQEDGCAGVIAERDRWASLVNDPVLGDEASVYAQHAINVLAFLDCGA
jgi:hypothetical protein